MTPSRLIFVILTASVFLVSGCVSNKTFNDFKAEMEQELEESRYAELVLACETRVDTYQDMVGSDEPIPTRRDEPIPTRRDLKACQDEFAEITNGNTPACRNDFNFCITPLPNGSGLTVPVCRGCYTTCLATGAWDAVTCPP